MTTSQRPSATLYILLPPSPLFAAHWSLFIPDTDTRTESDQGRRIHVSGDRLNGFHLEIIRNYNVRQHRSVGPRHFAIGRITSPHTPTTTEPGSREEKDEDEGGGFLDNVPRDALEEVCVCVEAPGPSLNSVSGGGNGRRVKGGEVRDCQWWVRRVVGELVARGLLVGDERGGSQRLW